MKKCPYCSELVQDEAKKCKHCGEWFESKTESILSKTKNLIAEKKEERNAKKIAHLILPTEKEPLVVERASFFPDRCVIANITIPYSQINNIEFQFSVSEINFGVYRDMTFALHHSQNRNEKSKRTLIIGVLENGVIKSRPSKKIAEQLQLASNFISKITYQKRVALYILELQEKGYFTYKNTFKFYANGDVEKGGKIKANIKKKWDNKELTWMPSSSGYRSSSFYPYNFSFKTDNVPWYNLIEKTTLIETTFDKDVFDPMLINFFKSGSYLPHAE